MTGYAILTYTFAATGPALTGLLIGTALAWYQNRNRATFIDQPAAFAGLRKSFAADKAKQDARVERNLRKRIARRYGRTLAGAVRIEPNAPIKGVHQLILNGVTLRTFGEDGKNFRVSGRTDRADNWDFSDLREAFIRAEEEASKPEPAPWSVGRPDNLVNDTAANITYHDMLARKSVGLRA